MVSSRGATAFRHGLQHPRSAMLQLPIDAVLVVLFSTSCGLGLYISTQPLSDGFKWMVPQPFPCQPSASSRRRPSRAPAVPRWGSLPHPPACTPPAAILCAARQPRCRSAPQPRRALSAVSPHYHFKALKRRPAMMLLQVAGVVAGVVSWLAAAAVWVNAGGP